MRSAEGEGVGRTLHLEKSRWLKGFEKLILRRFRDLNYKSVGSRRNPG